MFNEKRKKKIKRIIAGMIMCASVLIVGTNVPNARAVSCDRTVKNSIRVDTCLGFLAYELEAEGNYHYDSKKKVIDKFGTTSANVVTGVLWSCTKKVLLGL